MNDTRVSSLLLLTGVMLRVAVPAATGQETWPPDEAQLKAYFMGEFIAIDGYDSDNTRRLKAGGISDEQLRRVLSEIYTESDTAFGKAKDTYERLVSTQRRQNAIRELAVCADETTKAFLLDLAADKTKDGFLRTIAIGSYLSAADAEEAKDALIHFLVTPDQIACDMDRSEVYTFAYTAWKESFPEKKLAICEALQVGLAHESTHWVFCSGDVWLSGMSAKYSRSKERLALLERMYFASVPDGELFDKQSLVQQLEVARKLKTHTSVNTNLMTAIARDFNQPLSEEDLADLAVHPPTMPMSNMSRQANSLRAPRTGLYAFGGAAAIVLVVAGTLCLRKKRNRRRRE